VTVSEFWEMTPRETMMAIEAAIWRDERAQKQALSAAWHTAALARVKRLPALAQLFAAPARKLRGRELEKRRREFAEMSAAKGISELLARKQAKRRPEPPRQQEVS
jgi:soluble lytic murein transglycosylase-like protein